uniref:Ig-like domain-containing protein n=1 Tax=Gopherus evgoodei TaxID=1825980 RepID=A0A8C4Y4N7_9SAUR
QEAGSVAAVTLTQPSSALAKPGSSVTLECVASGYNINDHHMHWTRQTPGKGLVWIAAFKTGGTTYISNDFKGRITPSTSGSTGKLKIDGLTAADTATYYCSRHSEGSWGRGAWGGLPAASKGGLPAPAHPCPTSSPNTP